MSYKSLLFCADERTAAVISQVLTELEFSVELINDTFAAAKKLNEARFDALVVDCQKEQDASVLFKASRDSAQNHSSLSVAIVDGQAGVAKAFRIGANLVLSKPINIEQSKGTLRVARGLLRKNDAQRGTAPVQAGLQKQGTSPSVLYPQASTGAVPANAVQVPQSTTVASTQSDVPFSALEVEADPTPEPEAAEVAALESLPGLSGRPLSDNASASRSIQAEPIAGAPTGAAAAVAPALEKPATIERKAETMPPMVTNEPIVSEVPIPERFDKITSDVPVFSSLQTGSSRGIGTKFKFVAVLLALAAVGYFGWTKLQPIQYLQRMHATQTSSPASASDSAPAPAPVPAAMPTQSPSPTASAPVTPEPNLKTQRDLEISASSAHSDSQDDETGDIEVQELPMSRDSKFAPAKPAPLVVKPDAGPAKPKSAQPAPPPVQVSEVKSSALPLGNLTDSSPTFPKLAPASVRVSQGVSQGLILKKVPPAYPPMALQLRKQGAVELLVTITKQGTISNIKVTSGDNMLAKAAVDAVRQWKYRPYLLNGEPVEIQTQITINFTAPR